ncbi:MAG: hypothetical protein K8S62_00035 [Candidatus Sabulitectum sp.]|nr:hypothetical protein [Candidatus Sabulitectum sp.]
MKNWIALVTTVLIVLLSGCGDSTGPSESDLTPSVLTLTFTGDSLKAVSPAGILGFTGTKENCEVTVSWTICPESAFSNYVLYRSETSGIPADQSGALVLGVFSDANSNEYIDADVQWGIEYYYALRTQDEDDDGVWSNEDSIKTPGSAPTPSVLSAEVSAGSVILQWTECPDSDFYSYRLYRSPDPGIQNDTTFADNIYTATSSSDTLFKDLDVSSGSEYYYALLTTNSLGFSSWSNEENVTVIDDLPQVQGLMLDAASTGRTVILAWNPLACQVDGYQVYYREEESGTWALITATTDTTAEITAVCAGYYSVRGFVDDIFSESFSAPVNTMPNIISVSYTIYDNYCSADRHSGFIFGPTAGVTGMAPSTSFQQDIYTYDDSKGDNEVSLYSGNYGPFGNGNQSYFQEPASGVYGSCDPDGTWLGSSYELYTSDHVVFIKLPFVGGSNAYVKMYGLTVVPDPATANGTMVSFSYEYQPNDLGLTLFTSNWQ